MARLNLRDGSSVTVECLGWDRDELGARKRFKWAISAPAEPCIGEGSDLRGPVDADVTSEEMLTSWLGFAGAAAEARQFGGTGSENWDLFPAPCGDWIFRHSTELQAAELEREEGGHDWCTAPLFTGDWVLAPDGQRGEVVDVSRDGRWASIEGSGARMVPELDGAACWDLGEWPVEQLQLIGRGQEGRWADEKATEISTADRRGRVEDAPDAA